ncbi:MAG: C45 family autoproteolytic acyltransferase/hydrolase [Thermomicrobiales bacterium]
MPSTRAVAGANRMIPLIETGGSWSDIGHDIGAGAREQIQAAAASARAELGGVDLADVAPNIGPYLRATEDVAPDIIAELRGMAAGSGVPFETLFVLNAGAELTQSLGRMECSVVAVSGSGTADNHVLLAHNEDATAGWGDLAYVVKVAPDHAPAFAAFTYAGLLLHQGVNRAGLGSVGNALYARDARPGIPKLLLYRRAIVQPTIERAIRAVTDRRRAFGNNHLFATADGDLYDVEVSGSRWAMRPGRNGFLAHANHFTLPEMAGLDEQDDLLNSRLRQIRLETLVEREWGAITPAGLRAIMADHANYPRSICKHHAPDSELDYGTIGSVVIDVTARALWACAGNPCRAVWREVRL